MYWIEIFIGTERALVELNNNTESIKELMKIIRQLYEIQSRVDYYAAQCKQSEKLMLKNDFFKIKDTKDNLK